MSKEREGGSGAAEGARRTARGAPEPWPGPQGNWSAKRNLAAVLRPLRGEDLEALSSELGVTAAALFAWCDQVLAGGEANLKARESQSKSAQTQRPKVLVADLIMSDDFLTEITFLGMESSPDFVRQPEGNGCVGRFIRTLKEQLLRARTFHNVAELRQALAEFRERYNQRWLVERLGYLTPQQARQQLYAQGVAA